MTADELIDKRRRVNAVLKTFFSSASGQEALDLLEFDLYYTPLNTTDPYETYFRLGMFEVIQTLKIQCILLLQTHTIFLLNFLCQT